MRIALFDMNQGQPNRGIACIERVVLRELGPEISLRRYSVRDLNELPASIDEFDACVSSGGPGDPWDGEHLEWEKKFFALMDQLVEHNARATKPSAKKHFFAICHTFQLLSRYFKIADVTERRFHGMGIVPIHRERDELAMHDPMIAGLANPFYVMDSRSWQVVNPDMGRIEALGARILCRESTAPDAALTAIRFTPEIEGVQFHPEAGMDDVRAVLADPKNSELLTSAIRDPEAVQPAYETILPGFLRRAREK